MGNIDFSVRILYAYRCCDCVDSVGIIIKTISNKKETPARISTELLRNNKIYDPTKITLR